MNGIRDKPSGHADGVGANKELSSPTPGSARSVGSRKGLDQRQTTLRSQTARAGSTAGGVGGGATGAGPSLARLSRSGSFANAAGRRRRWYLGIQSKKEAAHVMTEVSF